MTLHMMMGPSAQLRSADENDSQRTERKSNRKKKKSHVNNNLGKIYEPRNMKDYKKSGMRFKYMLEAVRIELQLLQQENQILRQVVREQITPYETAERVLMECESEPVDIFLQSSILVEEEAESQEGYKDSLVAETEKSANTETTPDHNNKHKARTSAAKKKKGVDESINRRNRNKSTPTDSGDSVIGMSIDTKKSKEKEKEPWVREMTIAFDDIEMNDDAPPVWPW